MIKVYAGETPPESFEFSIFLAGPTPRTEKVPSWRPRALEFLEDRGYMGVVFIPEPREGVWPDYTAQVKWEAMALNMSDQIVFWIPRNMATLPGLTTNDEFGWWRARDPMRCVLGTPLQTEADSIRYQHVKAHTEHVPDFWTLEDTLAAAMDNTLKRASVYPLRIGGERCVPLHIWSLPSFQEWLTRQRLAGNRLDDARVEWVFRVGPNQNTAFFWALWVSVWVASENRHKSNEVVMARPDIACIVAVHKSPVERSTRVALIQEYRSPVNNGIGKVLEVPGGSSFKPTINVLDLAAAEFREETGLDLPPERFSVAQTRQMLSTMSAHRAHVFTVTLTDAEMDILAARERDQTVFGVAGDTERTTIAVRTVHQLLEDTSVDWSMMGIILGTILR